MNLKIKKISEYAVIPKRATEGSAGLDISAAIAEPMNIRAGERALIPCGFSIELPSSEYAAFIFARSGLATKHGIALSNGVGVVDSDYRGEIKVGIINQSNEHFLLSPGERIAQMVIMPVSCMPVLEVSELNETQRGDGGFGSTGLKSET